jgi:hypothetical protein
VRYPNGTGTRVHRPPGCSAGGCSAGGCAAGAVGCTSRSARETIENSHGLIPRPRYRWSADGHRRALQSRQADGSIAHPADGLDNQGDQPRHRPLCECTHQRSWSFCSRAEPRPIEKSGRKNWDHRWRRGPRENYARQFTSSPDRTRLAISRGCADSPLTGIATFTGRAVCSRKIPVLDLTVNQVGAVNRVVLRRMVIAPVS